MGDKNFAQKFVELIVKKRFLFATLVLLISIVSGVLVYKNFRVFTNFFDLYPPNHPYIKTYTEFREMFGSANMVSLCVLVKNGDIYTIENIKKIDGITLDILKLDGVNPYQVSSITHPSVKKIRISSHGITVVPLIEKIPETLEELERVKHETYITEGVRGAYISPDNKSALILAGFWEETDLSKIYEKIDGIIKNYRDQNTEIYVIGYPMLYAWIYHNVSKILLVFIISGLSLAFLLYLNFRTIRGVAIPIASAALSALWAFAFASAMNYNLDLLIMVVPVLLIGRTLSHSVQCLERYYENVTLHNGKNQAIIATYSELFAPATFSIITDGLGVLTIAVARIPLMQKLAYIGGFWIISMIVSILVFQPLLQSFLVLRKSEIEGRTKTTLFNLIDKVGFIGKYCCRGSRPKWIFPILILVVIAGGTYTTSRLVVGDTRLGATIFYPDHPYNVGYNYINKNFWGTNEFIIIMAGKGEEALKNPELLTKIENFCYYMGQDPSLGGSATFLKLVQSVNRIYHEGVPKWEVIPSDKRLLSQILFLVQANASPGELSRFFSGDYKNASLMFYYKDYSNKIVNDILKRAKEFISNETGEGGSFRLAGGLIGITAAVNSEVEWSYWANLITILGMVILICLIIYRSIKVAFILVLPLCLAQILCDFLMLFKGIDLNINSLPVTSIGVGVGIDYSIYIMDRILVEYRKYGTYDQALQITLSTTGHAVVFTAMTVVASIIFWFISGIKFHTEMANLISLLMVFNMLGAITLIPVMVVILKPFGKEASI